MSKTKMAAARELINEKHYDEARALLKTVEHPTAKEWLSKLNKIAPVQGFSEVTDQELAQSCYRADAFKELAWRIKEMTWKSEQHEPRESDYKRVYALSEYLCENLSNSNEELIRNSCYLLGQIPTGLYYANDDPRVAQLAAVLKKNRRDENGPGKFDEVWYNKMQRSLRIYGYAQNALMNIYTPQARVAVMSTPHDHDWPVPYNVKKLSNGNFVSQTPNMVREYAVFMRDEFLFSLKILRIASGNYEIKWPDLNTVEQHFSLVDVAFELAYYDIRLLEFEDEKQSMEEEGWQTYINDIAPYVDDD